jgi:hypothetical protein
MSGKVVGRRSTELVGDDDFGGPAAHSDEPDPSGGTAHFLVALAVDFDTYERGYT